MRRPLAPLAFLLALVVLTLPELAWAQTVTISQSGFIVRRAKERSSGEAPYTINRQDCLDDDDSLGNDRTVIHMTPKIAGFNNNMNLEVWVGNAGTACAEQLNRQPPTGRCNLVFSNRVARAGETFTIRPRDVIEGIRRQNATDVRGEGTRESCEEEIQLNIVYHLMLVQGGTIQGSTATWDKSPIDTYAPPPPTQLTINAGDQLLFPEWEIPPTSEASDTQGFYFYCEKLGAGAPPVPQEGAGGEGPISAACSGAPSRLVPGRRPDGLDKLRCGRAMGRATRVGQVEAKPALENGSEYAVGVAAFDQVGNLGNLSPIACGTPKEVISFFDLYKESGGQGGGGLCEYNPLSRPSSVVWGLLSTVLVILWRRRSNAA